MTNKEAIDILINYFKPPIIRNDGKSMAHLLALEAIGKAVDALEVEPKHGRWIEVSDGSGYVGEPCEACSVCGMQTDYPSNYCPNCGTDMREVEECD